MESTYPQNSSLIKEEMEECKHYLEDNQLSDTGKKEKGLSNLENTPNNSPYPADAGSKSKGIVAKLAHKLNSKLNSVFIPRTMDSLLACLEPEISVSTSGIIKAGAVYVCPWCPFTTSNAESLKEHKNLCHRLPAGDQSHCGGLRSKILPDGTTEHPHTCGECGKTFARSWHLQRHYIIHTGEKPFICVDCGESYSTGAELKGHQREHTIKSRNVKTDSQSHSSEKPYKCADCEERFHRTNDLKVHRRIHTGERPFICPECGESFTQKGNLTVHIRTHTGERPFECHLCGKCFLRRSILNDHMKVHQDERDHRTRRGAGEILPRFFTPVKDMIVNTVAASPSLVSFSEENKEKHKSRGAIAGALKESNNFNEMIAERLKLTGVLSFGGGKIQLRVIDGQKKGNRNHDT